MSRPIKHGAVDQSTVLRFVDSADGTPETGVTDATAGLAIWYRREGGLKVAITPASLAALNTAHTDGGVEHVSDGYVRIDAPDAAFASGSTAVTIGGSATGMVVVAAHHPLVAVDHQDAAGFGLSRLDTAISTRATPAQVNTEADTALADYDAPTFAELDTRTDAIDAALVTLTAYVDTEVTAIKAKTDNLPSDPADASDIATAFAAVPAAVWTAGSRTLTGFGTLIADIKAALLGLFRSVMRKDLAADGDIGGAYDPASDSLEAIRDRGDAAWTTGPGTSTLTEADVRTAVGLAAANLDDQLSDLSDDVGERATTTEVNAARDLILLRGSTGPWTTGGDATAANQTVIINAIADVADHRLPLYTPDETGDYHGRLVGSVKPTLVDNASQYKAIRFDGVDRGGSSAGIDAGPLHFSGAFTLEFDLTPTVLPSTHAYTLMGDHHSVSGNGNITPSIATSGKLSLNVYDAAAGFHSIMSDAALVAGTEYRVQMNYDGTTIRMLVNGVLQADTEAVAGLLAPTVADHWWIGRKPDEPGASEAFAFWPFASAVTFGRVRLSTGARNVANYTPTVGQLSVDGTTVAMLNMERIDAVGRADIGLIEGVDATDQLAASGAVITPQAVADALKLAPTAGAAADGSVYERLTEIQETGVTADCPSLEEINGLLLSLLAGVDVTFDSLTDPESRTRTIVRGDSYLAEDGRAFTVSVTGAALPNDITGSEVWLRVQDKRYREQPLVINVEGEIVVAVGPTKTFTFELAVEDTTALTAPRYQADIEVLIGGDEEHTATPLILTLVPVQDARDETGAS